MIFAPSTTQYSPFCTKESKSAIHQLETYFLGISKSLSSFLQISSGLHLTLPGGPIFIKCMSVKNYDLSVISFLTFHPFQDFYQRIQNS